MFVQETYHLCAPCASRRWSDDDPVVRTAVDRNLRAAPEAKARCADCRTPVRIPHFRLCADCARRERLCQHCCGSTLSPEEKERLEAFERWRESYVAVVRTYGIRSPQARDHLAGCEDDEVRGTLAGMTIRELDWPRRLG